MFDRQIFLSKKSKYFIGLMLLLFIPAILVAFSIKDHDNFAFAQREISLRKIGHEVLLQSGDSTSRVLPIREIAENEYQIRFENEFTFQPDSLVNITGRLLSRDPLAHDYIVNVVNCGDASVAYGYAISKNKKGNMVSCLGRKQPTACYMINVKFKSPGINTAKSGYLLGGLPFLAFVGFMFLRSAKPKRDIPIGHHNSTYTIGTILFDANNHKLLINEQTVNLTGTESRLLLIFALSPNEIIDRSRLQKEIWEDEGVIVGRSLDMFISKLRKKLESDQTVKIQNIRGKGYKLSVNSEEL